MQGRRETIREEESIESRPQTTLIRVQWRMTAIKSQTPYSAGTFRHKGLKTPVHPSLFLFAAPPPPAAANQHWRGI